MPENFPLKVAVVGSTGRGDYGHDLDLAWKNIPETSLVAVADDNAMGLEAAKKRLSVDGYLDYREMLDKTKPDILCIAPRWLDRHFEMCKEAIGRGIHVYVEKPLCQNLEQADQLVQACEQKHVVLAMAVPTRYSPRMEQVKNILHAQKPFGPVMELRGRGKEDNRGGGEDLWVLGTHILDMIRCLAGNPLRCFATVTQDGKPISKSNVVEGAEGIGPLAGDAVHARFDMDSGVPAYFSSVRKMATSPSKYGLQIFCKFGVIELLEGIMPATHGLLDKCWTPPRGKGEWKAISSAGLDVPEPLLDLAHQERHRPAILDLVQAIRENRQPLANVYEARAAVEMVAAVFESARLGTPVAFPLRERRNPISMLT